MGRAVPRATGHAPGVKGGGKYRPQQINFEYLTGLSGSLEKELRATEDVLLDYIKVQTARDALYATEERATASELETKYPAMRKEGVG